MRERVNKMGHILLVAVLTAPLFWLGSVAVAQEKDPKPGTQVFQQLDVKQDDKKATIHYCLFLPESYAKTKTWPLMLFLHGAGERGDDLELVKKWGPPKRVGQEKDFPFVVVSPQCPKGRFWNGLNGASNGSEN